MTEKKSAFDIPKSSSFAKELQENVRRSRAQTNTVSKLRKQGFEPMALRLGGSGKLNPKDRA